MISATTKEAVARQFRRSLQDGWEHLAVGGSTNALGDDIVNESPAASCKIRATPVKSSEVNQALAVRDVQYYALVWERGTISGVTLRSKFVRGEVALEVVALEDYAGDSVVQNATGAKL